jgi:hypothetical protein
MASSLHRHLPFAVQGTADSLQAFNHKCSRVLTCLTLDIMCNAPIFDESKFSKGDGNLHYYTFNWKCPEVASSEVGGLLMLL